MGYDKFSYEQIAMQAKHSPYGCVEVVPNPFADQIEKLKRDRANLLDEAVKAQAECERQRQAADWFAAERDNLKNKYENMCDELAKQLALSRLEHAKEADELGKQVSEVHATNKELRIQLAESEAERLKGMDYMRMQEKRMRAAESELAAANEKLAALSEIYKAEVKRGYETREKLAALQPQGIDTRPATVDEAYRILKATGQSFTLTLHTQIGETK